MYLFFDEIQIVDHWEERVNSFLVELDADIYIKNWRKLKNIQICCGSLSGEVAFRLFISVTMMKVLVIGS